MVGIKELSLEGFLLLYFGYTVNQHCQLMQIALGLLAQEQTSWPFLAPEFAYGEEKGITISGSQPSALAL